MSAHSFPRCSRVGFLFAMTLSFTAVPAHAHHSFAIYDQDNPITLTGTVREHRWINPHAAVVLIVSNEDGMETDWVFDQGPVNMLSRQGWTRNTLKAGDRFQ